MRFRSSEVVRAGSNSRPSADTKMRYFAGARGQNGGGGLCRRLRWAGPGGGRLLGRSGMSRSALSGGLRWGDGDDAAGVEFLELADQVVLPGLGGFTAGVKTAPRPV